MMLIRFAVIVVLLTGAITPPAVAQRKPNVLFILSDEQASLDAGCYGSKDLATPNMDAIAAAGTRFTQFESAAPISAPSRAAILTGKYPQRFGIPEVANSIPGQKGLPPDAMTMPKLFKQAGYATAQYGKWDLGSSPDQPAAAGFDDSLAFLCDSLDSYSHFYYQHGPNRHDLWRNGVEFYDQGKFLDGLCASNCNTFIEQHATQPFFVMLELKEPHFPFQSTAKWREHYKDMPVPRQMYAASLSAGDEMIGLVLAKLDALNLRNETIVCFMSDEGYSCEGQAFGGHGTTAGPYRGAKFSLFEGGIRVPALISWPGHLPASSVRSQMCTGCDWLPTLAELCDIKLPQAKVDGKSLVSMLKTSDQSGLAPLFYWACGNDQWAVRDGDWKLIGNPVDPTHKGKFSKDDALFLTNLADDIGEKTNVAKAHADVVERLKKMHEQWMTQVGS